QLGPAGVGVCSAPAALARPVEFTALEVDLAVGLLVAAPPVAPGRTAEIVASASRLLALGQRLYGFAAVEAGAVDQYQLALARRDRVVGLECHCLPPYRPVVTSILWPSSRVTIARLTSDCSPIVPLKALIF